MIDSQFEKIRSSGVHVFDEKIETRPQLVPSIVVRLDRSISGKIYQSYIHLLPREMAEGLITQPYGGYHITLQWYEPEYHSPTVENALIEKIDELVKDPNFPHGCTLIYPIIGYYSVWAAMDNDTEDKLYGARKNIALKLKDVGINSGLNEERSFLSYINFARYSKRLRVSSEKLRTHTTIQQEVNFSSIELLLADKFVSIKSKLIKKWIL